MTRKEGQGVQKRQRKRPRSVRKSESSGKDDNGMSSIQGDRKLSASLDRQENCCAFLGYEFVGSLMLF